MVRGLVVAVALSLGIAAVAGAAEGAAPASASGEARVDGKPLVLAHAYLFHAPDNWSSEKINPVVLITVKPVDGAALAAAKTLGEALDLAPERVAVEVRNGGEKADLSICHPGFGEGMCYSTGIFPPEWSAAEAPAGHAAGSVKTFTGEEETVFQKYRLFYKFSYDAAPVRDFDRRR